MAQGTGYSGRAPWRGRGGFTLVEVLTAIIVMSVATSMFIQLFNASVNLSDSSRSRRVAAQLAEERLVDIQSFPGKYLAETLDKEGSLVSFDDGESLALSLRDDTESGQNEPPLAMPTNRRAFNREKNLYEGFFWEAIAHRPSEDSGFYALVVLVQWDAAGRTKYLTLTSSVPESLVGEMAE